MTSDLWATAKEHTQKLRDQAHLLNQLRQRIEDLERRLSTETPAHVTTTCDACAELVLKPKEAPSVQ